MQFVECYDDATMLAPRAGIPFQLQAQGLHPRLVFPEGRLIEAVPDRIDFDYDLVRSGDIIIMGNTGIAVVMCAGVIENPRVTTAQMRSPINHGVTHRSSKCALVPSQNRADAMVWFNFVRDGKDEGEQQQIDLPAERFLMPRLAQVKVGETVNVTVEYTAEKAAEVERMLHTKPTYQRRYAVHNNLGTIVVQKLQDGKVSYDERQFRSQPWPVVMD